MDISIDTMADDFIKLSKNLKKAKSFSTKNKILEEIDCLNSIFGLSENKNFCFDYLDIPYHDKLYQKQKKRSLELYTQAVFRTIGFFLQCAESYDKCLKSIDFFHHGTAHGREKYTEKESKELIFDFFSSFGNVYYKLVKNLFEENRISNKLHENDDIMALGMCYGFDSQIKPYVFFKNGQKDLANISYLVHELGHAIEFLKIQNRKAKFHDQYSFAFIEVASEFFEYEFLNYLEKNKTNEYDTNILFNDYFTFGRNFFNSLLEVFEDDELIIDNKYYLRCSDEIYIDDDKKIVQFFEEYDENLKSTGKVRKISMPIRKSIIYGVGCYLSLFLSELRKNDPIYFKKNLNTFLTMRTSMDYENIINMFGLSTDDLLSGDLIKSVINEKFESYKRQYKIKL